MSNERAPGQTCGTGGGSKQEAVQNAHRAGRGLRWMSSTYRRMRSSTGSATCR
jgi:hypothetical protein